jgi:hypothetical protein
LAERRVKVVASSSNTKISNPKQKKISLCRTCELQGDGGKMKCFLELVVSRTDDHPVRNIFFDTTNISLSVVLLARRGFLFDSSVKDDLVLPDIIKRLTQVGQMDVLLVPAIYGWMNAVEEREIFLARSAETTADSEENLSLLLEDGCRLAKIKMHWNKTCQRIGKQWYNFWNRPLQTATMVMLFAAYSLIL